MTGEPPRNTTPRRGARLGDEQVGELLRALAGRLEAALPGRLRSAYLLGSYAAGDAVALSDLDCAFIFRGELGPAGVETAQRVVGALGEQSAVRLDPLWLDEARLATLHSVHLAGLKLGSRHFFGEDVRDELALPPIERYTAELGAGAAHFLTRVLRDAADAAFPLDYPDPAGEFFGYDRVRIAAWYPPGTARGLKELVAAASRIASGLLAIQRGRIVAGKADSLGRFQAEIGGEWADYLAALAENGRGRWGYHVPAVAREQALLHELCRRMLAFENHFLGRYREYRAAGQVKELSGQDRLLSS
jgi:hypothetical protein